MSASSTLLSDAKAMIAAGPSVATASNAAGATSAVNMIDYVGMLQQYLNLLNEAYNLLENLLAATDSGDSNKTTLQSDILTLST